MLRRRSGRGEPPGPEAAPGTTEQQVTAGPEDEPADTAPGDRTRRARGIRGALGLTLVSAFVWGVAHLVARRRLTGGLLVAAFTLLLTTGAAAVIGRRRDLIEIAVRPDRLTAAAIGVLVLGLLWILIVIRSYQVIRPAQARRLPRNTGRVAVGVLCVLVAAPFAWAAQSTYLYRDALNTVFQEVPRITGNGPPVVVDEEDPWAGRRRVNILLLGGDAAANRSGVRTDSVTLASVDTTTGDTVLLSLPRNLLRVPMPPGPARDRFPNGFTGDGPLNPGLLNEVYQYAENHPQVVPGAARGRRGPELMKGTVGEILGLPVDYYVLVDMFGFADLIDAMGGVTLRIERPIPYGRDGGVLRPGLRRLGGKDALWYGRSRNGSDDYTRMGRQKCLLRAIAEQADPQRVLTRFQRLAAATKRTISTDIPQALLPALIDLSGRVRHGGQIFSLQFIPPLIRTAGPDYERIRSLSAEAITDSEQRLSASPSTSPSISGTPQPSASDGTSPRPASPLSLAETCPS